MSDFRAKDTKKGLSEIAEGVAVRIHVHVDPPNIPAGDRRHEAKNCIESDTRPVASVGESPSEIDQLNQL